MAKKLYRFPNSKMSLYATEKTLTNICTAIEQEILAKYEGEYIVGFDIFPGRMEDYHLLGDQLCYDVYVHAKKV